MASNPYHLPYWLEPPPSLDYLSHTLTYNESIMEVMCLDDIPSKYHQHRSYFLTPCHVVEEQFGSTVSSDIVTDPQSPILTHDVE